MTGLLSIKTLTQAVCLGKSTILGKVREGKFPKPIKLGPRCTRWRESDIDEWIKNLPKESV